MKRKFNALLDPYNHLAKLGLLLIVWIAFSIATPGFTQDDLAASKLYEQALARGNTNALKALYNAYRAGRGVKQDLGLAHQLLVKAAEGGNAWAQCELGYYFGIRRYLAYPEEQGPINMASAAFWYRRSADQNWSVAQYHLAGCYLAGEGVEQNEERGLELMRKAVDQNYPPAMYELADLYARGIGQSRNDLDLPITLLLRVAASDRVENGLLMAPAYDAIIYRYQYGVGAERNIITAVEYYCRAAAAGIDRYDLADKIEPDFSKRRLGGAPFNGESGLIGPEGPDNGDASRLFLEVLSDYLKAAQGNSGAMVKIGTRYLNGDEAPANPVNAWQWFTLASQHGSAEAGTRPPEIENHLGTSELSQAKQSLSALVTKLKNVAANLRGFGGSSDP